MTQVSELTREAIASTSTGNGWNSPGGTLREGLSKKGITVLGSGYYGAAIEEDGQVFKIYGTKEVGYNEFVNYAVGKRSVLLPQISQVGQFGEWRVVHIERLYSLIDVIGETDATMVGNWISYTMAKKLMQRGIDGRNWWSKCKFPKSADAIVNRANLIGLLTKMIDKMVEINSRGGKTIRFDVHRDNVMVRKNADGTMQLVLTDPWADND